MNEQIDELYYVRKSTLMKMSKAISLKILWPCPHARTGLQ